MNRFKSFNIGCFLRAICACFCLNATASSSHGQVDIINDEVVNKWKAYELFARSLQGTALETTTPDTGKTEHRLLMYKQNQACLMNIISKEQDPTEVCRIGNPHYAASVKRNKSDHSRVTLGKITLSPEGPFPGYAGDHVSVFDLTRSLISPHFTIGTVPLYQIFRSPTFTILNSMRVSENGQDLVRIDYKYSYVDSTIGAESRRQGSVFLDPSQCWCIRRSKRSGAGAQKGTPRTKGEEEIEYETINHASGYPLVKTKIQHINSYDIKTQKSRKLTTRIEYQWEVNDNLPDSEFTLTAFGLPEPMGVEPLPPSRNWLWLLAATLVAAVLAILFAWLRRRHARATPGSFTAS